MIVVFLAVYYQLSIGNTENAFELGGAGDKFSGSTTGANSFIAELISGQLKFGA